MATWITDDEKQKLISDTTSQFHGGTRSTIDDLREKMDMELLDSQIKAALAQERGAQASEEAAKASEKNAKYMLWSVVAAAASAIASLASAVISVVGHH